VLRVEILLLAFLWPAAQMYICDAGGWGAHGSAGDRAQGDMQLPDRAAVRCGTCG